MKHTLITILTVLSLPSTLLLAPSCRTQKQGTQSSTTHVSSTATTKARLTHDTHDTIARLLHIHTDSITFITPAGQDIAPSILKFHNVTASCETKSASHHKAATTVTDSLSERVLTQSDKTAQSKTSAYPSLASILAIITAVSALIILGCRYIRHCSLSSKSCRKQ